MSMWYQNTLKNTLLFFIFSFWALGFNSQSNAASMERTAELDRICERAVKKNGRISGPRNDAVTPRSQGWVLRKVKGSGWFDSDAYLKYFYTQKTRDGFEHSVTCKVDEYKWIEVENWVEGYGMAVVCYTGGDQDDMGC